MKEVFILLNEIKARALAAFRLTLSEIEEPSNELINIIEADEDDKNKECTEMEEFLNENLSNVKYMRAAKLLKEATDGKMKLRKKDEIFK